MQATTAPPPNRLSTIAQQMYDLARVQSRAYVLRPLFGGLQVALERNGECWRLAIARLDTMPTNTEVGVVARDFGVPEGTKWQASHKPNPKKKVTYKVLECTWREEES